MSIKKVKPIDILREGQLITVRTKDVTKCYVLGKDQKNEFYLYCPEDSNYDYTLSDFDDNLVHKSEPKTYISRISSFEDFYDIKDKNHSDELKNLYVFNDHSFHAEIDIYDILKVDDGLIIKVDGKIMHCHFAEYDKENGTIRTYADGKSSFTSFDKKMQEWDITKYDISLVNEHNRRLFV